MLQRIQTVYLTIAFIASVLLFFFPVAKILSMAGGKLVEYHFRLTGIMKMEDDSLSLYAYQPILLPLLIIITISLIIAIFMYKNRTKQVRFVAFVFLFVAALIGLTFYFVDKFGTLHNTNPNYKQFGFLLPIIIVIMLVLTNKAIKKDEMKVRQSERLR